MQNLTRTLCCRSPLLRTLPVNSLPLGTASFTFLPLGIASTRASPLGIASSRALSLGIASTRALSSTPWNLGILNHTAIAVPDLQKAISFYRDVLQAAVSEPEDLPEHGVTVVFVNLPNTKIELLYPLGENSSIAGFLKKNKDGGIHHVCIEVDDIESAVRDVRERGVRTLGENTKIGAHGKPVMFLHPKDCGGVLMELEQK